MVSRKGEAVRRWQKVLLSTWDSLARRGLTQGLRVHGGIRDTDDHTQGTQPWCAGWAGQERQGMEEVQKWSQELGVVVHAYNLSAWEAGTKG